MTTSPIEWSLVSESPEATRAIGRSMGSLAEPGLVIGLIGPLGAGKTLLVRGFAEGLEVADSRLVSSPTFILMQEYPGRIPIFHFDTYRLKTAAQFAELGIEEYYEADGVCIVEWADRVLEYLPADRLEVRMVHTGRESRGLEFRAAGERAGGYLAQLRRSWE